MAELIENKVLRRQVILKNPREAENPAILLALVDGIMGPATMTAIDVFKISKGYPLGGYLDQRSLDALGIEVN